MPKVRSQKINSSTVKQGYRDIKHSLTSMEELEISKAHVRNKAWANGFSCYALINNNYKTLPRTTSKQVPNTL